MPVVIASFEASHWQEARRIYLDGIATGNATFETGAPPWEDWDRAPPRRPPPRRARRRHRGRLGCAVAGVRPLRLRGRRREFRLRRRTGSRTGLGQRLLEELIERAEAAGIWTIQTGIFPENQASLRLHARVGFRVVGVRERLGKLHGTWRDVVFLERRSNVVQ